MDKFRIGQKVRIVKANRCKHLIGKVYTVTGISGFVSAVAPNEPCYTLDWKESKLDFAEECVLEPVYDGDAASSWSESVWKPKELIKE